MPTFKQEERLSEPVGVVRRSRRVRVFELACFLALLLVGIGMTQRIQTEVAGKSLVLGGEGNSRMSKPPSALPSARQLQDSIGDGFADTSRLADAQDRENFIRWFTFLAEASYYVRSRPAEAEVQDCSALVRFAFRNALVRHSAAWRRAAVLPYDPGFGDVTRSVDPHSPLGPALFRTRAGPFDPADFERGAFAEFADSATLLRYNTFRVSRDLRAARPGDLLFFCQRAQHEPYHTMIFVGASHFQPRGSDWIVYHTGDLNGRRGEIREVQAGTLVEHPEARWRPLLANPYFLGVYRLEILR